MMREAAIVGIGRTEYTKESGRTSLAMAAEATRRALDDSGLHGADVDGIINFQMADSPRAVVLGHAVGADDLAWVADFAGGGNLACSVVGDAFSAVTVGMCDVAVVFRSLNGRSGPRHARGDQPRVALEGEMQYAAPHGYVVPPQWVAMWAQRYLHEFGASEEDLGHIAITTRAHAVANEHAMQRTPLTMDDYLAGRWIAEPFRVFDCCLETDGAVALVLTTLDRARDLPHRPVAMLARGEAHTHGASWSQYPDFTEMYAAHAARRLWAKTDLVPQDLDLACVYDCFTYTVTGTVEGFGICPPGSAGAFFAEGRATYGGDLVINPHGGLLSEGYIHGLNHHYEAVLQLRGAAGTRQVADAQVALVTAGTGPFGGALVYGADW